VSLWLLCHAGGLYLAASGALKLSYVGLLAFAFIAGAILCGVMRARPGATWHILFVDYRRLDE
jgi:hypothetical protein